MTRSRNADALLWRLELVALDTTFTEQEWGRKDDVETATGETVNRGMPLVMALMRSGSEKAP